MSMQLIALTIKVRNPHATQKNYYQIKQFLLSNYVYIMQEKPLKGKKIKCTHPSTFTIHFRVKLRVLYNTKNFQQCILNMIYAAILSHTVLTLRRICSEFHSLKS